MTRCYNKNHIHYARYGGNGIDVCVDWHDFRNFKRDMGERPKGMSIERKNNALGYSKDNCVWATSKEQARNRKNNKCTIEMARGIQAMRDAGIRPCEIGKKFSHLSQGTISEISRRKMWA